MNTHTLDEARAAKTRALEVFRRLASVVGVGMRSHVGIASTMFRTLSEEGINIQMISTSEIKISVLIDEKYMELAVRALQNYRSIRDDLTGCLAVSQRIRESRHSPQTRRQTRPA